MKNSILIGIALITLTACGSGRKVLHSGNNTSTKQTKAPKRQAVTPEQYSRKDVTTDSGYMNMHPLKVEIQISEEETYYCFFAMNKKIMFITENTELYEKFSAHIPEQNDAGNFVVLFGPLIDPFTTFSDEQLNTLKNQVMRKVGFQLNQYKIAKLSNYVLRKKGGVYISPEKIAELNNQQKDQPSTGKPRSKDGY